MNQILEDRIARLASVLDAESTALVLQPEHDLGRVRFGRRRRVLLAVATVVVLALVSTAWALASRGNDGASVHTDPIANEPTTVAPAGPDLQTVQLSAAEQVDWLIRQRQGEASVHTPGWRPELSAERVECDYAGVSAVSAPTMAASATEFPLGEPITADRLLQECGNGADATRAAGVDLSSQGTLCRSVSTRRVVGPDSEGVPSDVVVTEPSVIFTGGSCEASGYETPAPDFVDSIEQQRRTEILLRAVPRLCPTVDEARAWVERQIKSLPDHWTVDIRGGSGCALPLVDWWTHRIFT